MPYQGTEIGVSRLNIDGLSQELKTKAAISALLYKKKLVKMHARRTCHLKNKKKKDKIEPFVQ